MPATPEHLPGRPKTDKLDAVWLAKLSERGMLRPSFIAPAPIRRLRDYTRLRADLTDERSRHQQRLEKLLEDALIKLSTVATDSFGVSGRAMLEALMAGQRDPRVLAELARGRLRVKHAALVEALTGQFCDHHGFIARMLLDQIDALSGQLDQLTAGIEQTIAATGQAGIPGPGHTESVDPATGEILAALLPAVDRLDEVAGIGRAGRPGAHRRGRAGHGPVPHPWAAGVVGQAIAAHDPVRRQPPRRHHRQGQPLP
jgi:transposase